MVAVTRGDLPRVYLFCPSVFTVRRLYLVFAVSAMALAACAAEGVESTTTAAASVAPSTETAPTPDASTDSSVAPGGSTTSPPEETATTSGRPIAPDFTLDLGEGGTYTLSEGARPVYLVFWAEW